MIELGKIQKLQVLREREFGVYLGRAEDGETGVLLPRKYVPEGIKPGEELEVFIYKDSEDRLIATTEKPLIQVGQVAVLEVKDVSKIGAFLDMGLEKDLLLPFKEQSHRVKRGEKCLVALYVDRSQRLAATMKVYTYMRSDSPYQKDDWVTGTIYELSDKLGAFVAVDNQYYGLIPRSEMFRDYREGEVVEARVSKVRSDGKLDLNPQAKAYQQMETDAETIMKVIDELGGELPFNDKVSPEVIRREFGLSKNAFKRAVGRLLKENRITITEETIKKV